MLLLMACYPGLSPDHVTNAPWKDYDHDGYSTDDGDCDDADNSAFPGAVEGDDEVDNDCDGQVDEDFVEDTGVVDRDGDGWSEDEDCNDDIQAIHPEAEEVRGNDIDEDCDGVASSLSLGFDPVVQLNTYAEFSSPDTPGHVFDSGDVLGMGTASLVIGVPDEGVGAVYLLTDFEGGELDAVAHRIEPVDQVQFGEQIVVGDLDGDGLDDVVTCSWNGGSVASLYTFLSDTVQTATSTSDADHSLESTLHNGFCEAMTGGDVNGDGALDLAVAAPWNGTTQGGAVWVFTDLLNAAAASDGDVIYGQDGDELSRLAMGDIDGDGDDELFVGAPDSSQQVASGGVVYGWMDTPVGLASDADITLHAGVGGDYFGVVNLDGDVDGDGLADLLVGADEAAGADGAAYLFLGADLTAGSGGFTTFGAPAGSNQRLGYGLGYAGDVDHDGRDDLLLGAVDVDRAFLFLASSLVDADGELSNRSTDDADTEFVGTGGTGFGVGGLGDINGDDVDDFAISTHAGPAMWVVQTPATP
jgi:hypothetical protein